MGYFSEAQHQRNTLLAYLYQSNKYLDYQNIEAGLPVYQPYTGSCGYFGEWICANVTMCCIDRLLRKYFVASRPYVIIIILITCVIDYLLAE